MNCDLYDREVSFLGAELLSSRTGIVNPKSWEFSFFFFFAMFVFVILS